MQGPPGEPGPRGEKGEMGLGFQGQDGEKVLHLSYVIVYHLLPQNSGYKAMVLYPT